MLYKLGAIPYLNGLPLIHYLKGRPRPAPPAALVRLLKIGEVDIATAPIVSLFENPHFSLIPGICIGSNGPVESVKLFFNTPEITAANVRSIYLDLESRTSVLLLKVLLKFKYGRDLNEISFHSPIPPPDLEAKLLIGDKAMREVPEAPPLDLGSEWTDWTGLPFVYAAWISRLPEVGDRALRELTEARDRGCANIASVIPTDIPFPFDLVKNYLENRIIYRLGDREREGMDLFRDYLLQADWIENLPSLKYAVS